MNEKTTNQQRHAMKTNHNNTLARVTGFGLAGAFLAGAAGFLTTCEIPTARGGASN